MCYKLTDIGRKKCEAYIAELQAKKKEILDAGIDTADETFVDFSPEGLLEDLLDSGMDEYGEICNGYGVTDHYDADAPICLKCGTDFVKTDQNMSKEEKTIMSEFRKDWIITSVSTEADEVSIRRFYGTEQEMKELLVHMALADKEENSEEYEYGTEEAAEVEESRNECGVYTASGTYSSFHILYTAKEWACVEHIRKEELHV